MRGALSRPSSSVGLCAWYKFVRSLRSVHGSVRQCAVCGSARGSVRYCVAVCGSAPGCVWQCARQCARIARDGIWQCAWQYMAARAAVCSCAAVRQCAAVRLVVYGSARGKLWQCRAPVRQCGSVRQCSAVFGSVCGSVCAVVWGSAHSTCLHAVCVVRAAVCSSALGSV
jgi:hypothetical protein